VETAGFVKAVEVRFVVDVQPLPAALATQLDGARDQLRAEAAPLYVGMHGRIEQESMAAAVGRDVHVTYEPLAVVGAQMDEADLPARQAALPWVAPGRFPERAEGLARRERVDTNVDAQSFLLNMIFASPIA
jgi:hypothetical protein